MSISTKKLNALREYFINEGSPEAEDVMAQLGITDEAVMDGYIAALKVKWPKDFDADYVEPEETEDEFTFWLLNDNNTLSEIEKTKEKNGKVIFSLKEPHEYVDIVVAGEVQNVDLIKLRKDPATNARLIAAAELAQG